VSHGFASVPPRLLSGLPTGRATIAIGNVSEVKREIGDWNIIGSLMAADALQELTELADE
jgi:hypothetical protein